MIRRIGDRLILVGVAHILPESREEVKRTIWEEKPEVVAVELCLDRYIELTSESSDGGASSGFSKTALLAKVLRYFQERMGRETGMFPGDEMLAAIREAREVGAGIKLIDRDISLTLRRLMDKMTFFEKIRLMFEMISSFFLSKGEFELEELAEEEVVEDLLLTFKEFSEAAYEVLIEERNDYMIERISELLKSGTGTVICVVGAGHVPGLSEELKSRYERGDFVPWDSFQMSWKNQ